MTIKRNSVACILMLISGLLVFPTMLWAQDSIDTEGPQDAAEYVIRDVDYIVEGRTRKSILIHYLEIERGTVFADRPELEDYLADKMQLIKNQRTLAEGDIAPIFEPDPENVNRVYVDLQVYVRDTWNYIVLPYAKYDSNEGLLLSLRGRNYNFLGGMEELEINLDYTKSDLNENEYSVNSSFAIPFYLLGFEWKFDFEEDVIFEPDEPTYFYTKGGLLMEIPMDVHTWQASIDQKYYLNRDGEEDPDGWYMTTGGRFGSTIPLGLEMPGFGELHYSPAMITSVAYKPGDVISEDRRGYELGAEHGITTGRIDWKGNFRDGMELELYQNARWNFQRERVLSDFDAELQVHRSLGFMGFSSRFQGFYKYGGEEEDAGDVIRGILDRRIDGDAGVYANLDFPFKMWIWFMERWFEGHISPFFDYALVSPVGEDFDLADGWYGGGIEIFGFPKFARSIYLRMSLGVDLEAVFDGVPLGGEAPRDGDKIYELYIGLGHHY